MPNPIEQSGRFNRDHRISESERIAYGYRDAGRRVQFGGNGNPITPLNREVIVVKSPQDDPSLKRAIDYASSAMRSMSTTEEKARFLSEYVQKLLPENDIAKNKSLMDRIAGRQGAVGAEISLGQLIDARTGVCRHRSLLFKVIADEVGVQTALVRGNYWDGQYGGAHAWNEVVLENQKRLVVDVMLDFVGGADHPEVQNYTDTKNNPLYRNDFLDREFNGRMPKAQKGSHAFEAGIANQNWVDMTSPREGVVKRADASAMNPAQREVLLNELRKQGIHAAVVYSRAFDKDYIQVKEADFARFDKVVRGEVPNIQRQQLHQQSGLIAEQNWQPMSSPRDGVVMRADVSGMNEVQRNALLQELNAKGIDARGVHSNTFNKDYVQVQEGDFAAIERARNPARAPVVAPPNRTAQQNWQPMSSPRDGVVMRADVSGMNEVQRNALLQELNAKGIDARGVHSNTFNKDYVQVQESDFAALERARDPASASQNQSVFPQRRAGRPDYSQLSTGNAGATEAAHSNTKGTSAESTPTAPVPSTVAAPPPRTSRVASMVPS